MAGELSPHGADCLFHHSPQLWEHQFLPEGWVGLRAELWVPSHLPGDFRACGIILQPKRGFPTGPLRAAHPATACPPLGGTTNLTMKVEADNSTNCLREMAWKPGARGMAYHRVLNLQMSAQWGILPAQKEDGSGLCTGPGNTLHRWDYRSSTS